MSEVTVQSAFVNDDTGVEAARVERVDVGGGTVLKSMEEILADPSSPAEVTHATSVVFHVTYVSVDPLLPNTVVDASSYDEACNLATDYANKVSKYKAGAAATAAELTASN
jgi:hypothetical protein